MNVLRDPTSTDDATPYPDTEWTWSSSYPTAFVRNQNIFVQLVCNVSPADASGTVYVKGTGDYAFNAAFNVVSGGSGLRFSLSSSSLLPNYVTTVSNARITWEYQPEGGSWSTLGTSTNRIYVTLQSCDPSALLYHTVMETACGTSGATTEAGAFANIWSRFSGKDLNTIDGTDLFYYEPPNTDFAFNDEWATSLLFKGTGECGAWRDFMANCLLLHDISGWLETDAYCSGQNANDSVLVIKNWQQDNGGTQPDPFKWRIKSSTSACFEMVPRPAGNDYGDLTQTAGILGQQSRTPSEKIFGAHYFLKYGSTYYDPSYGVTYGFGETCVTVGVDKFMDVRLSSGSGGVAFSN